MALLFITAFAAYWQVITFGNCLKWDMVDQYFPWRYHVISCLRAGELPLWNPYNFAGYPIHADPQSGAWYMPLWLFSLFGNYTSHANAVEVFIHIWLAGVGMYLLTRRLYGNHNIALIAGASYIGCGLLVGNAQHFTYIISACWLPFVLLYFVKTIQDKGYKNPLVLALFLWLFFTGGYPAFFIITVYILAAAFIFYWIKNRAETKALLLKSGLAGLVFLLLSSPSIISFALYWNDTTRSNGLSLADALFGPFRVQDVQSFFNPMLSAIKKENTGTDLSMMNGYFGLIPLVFVLLIIPFYKQLTKRDWFIIAVTFICLLAAFGDTFFIPVRQFLFHLPGLGIFRFPSIFRLFAIIGFVLMGAGMLNIWSTVNSQLSGKKWMFGSVGIITLVIVALSLKNIEWGSVASDFRAFRFIWADLPGSSAAAVLGGGLQLVFLSFVFFFRNNLKALSFIAIANCIVFTQLNIHTTVINKESPQVIESFLAKMPHELTIDNTRAMDNAQFMAPSPLWRNLGIFYKQPSYDGNNPFRLKNFADMEQSDEIVVTGPLPMASLVDNTELKVEMKGYGEFTVHQKQRTVLFQQNTKKYWTITDYWDSVEVPATVNYRANTFPEVKSQYGAIRYVYNPPYLRLAFWVSVLTLLGCLGFIFFYRKSNKVRG
jgi:hypothetical protein